MLQIMRREILLLIKERSAIFFVLMGAASAYALLIGNLYAGQIVQNIPVAVCDLDDSALSRQLTRTVAESDQFVLTENLPSEIEAVKILERGTAAAVLVIPQDFSKNFYAQQPTELAFLADGSNIVQVNYSTTPINLIAGNFLAQYNQAAAIANATPELSPAPISMSLRMSGNSVQGYLEFYIYGVMLLAAHVGISLAFGFSIFADKKNPACATVKVILTKEMFYLALSLASVMLGMVLLAAVFDVPFRGEIWQMLLICAAILIADEILIGILALVFKTHLSLLQCITFYTLPALLTVGYIFPEIAMTEPIKFLARIQPVHYALADFRTLALTGSDSNFWAHAVNLFLIALLAQVLLLAMRRNALRS